MVDRDTYATIPSRFERLIVQTTFLDEIIRTKKTTQGQNKRLRTILKKPKPAIAGSIRSDPMYAATLQFSPVGDANAAWTEPLVNPKGNVNYYVTCDINQLQGDQPYQIQGFQTVWYAPSGWTWVDGQGTTLYDEAISNPLSIRRIVHAPVKPVYVGFRVVITDAYLP